MATTHTAAQMKYDKEHRRVYGFRLHNDIDRDIIEKLASVPSMQGYIKQLIRDDIARTRIRTRTESVPASPFGKPEIDDETRAAIDKQLTTWLKWYKLQYGEDFTP